MINGMHLLAPAAAFEETGIDWRPKISTCSQIRQHSFGHCQSASYRTSSYRGPFTCKTPHVRRQASLASQATAESRGGPGPNADVLRVEVGGREVSIETGEIGKQANGAVLVRDGETAIYTTACCSGENLETSFLPFGVHYTERFSAGGKTSGSFFRREGRPKQLEMITARLTDRPLRPMFPKGWNADTQVLSWLLSYDGQAQPEPLSITAAGAALAISDIPLSKAVAGVRVGLIDGQYIVNPTLEQQSKSQLDLIMAGTADAILMIEGFSNFLTDEQMLKALETGSKEISKLCTKIQAWAESHGKRKREDRVETDTSWDQKVSESKFAERLKQLYKDNLAKQERGEAVGALRADISAELTAQASAEDQSQHAKEVGAACKRLEAKVMRELVVEDGLRADGRGLTDVRPISSSCGLLPRTHGSTLFTRGETQAIAVTTLGAMSNSIMQDNLATDADDKYQRFYLQYSFPPSSTGETGRVGFLGRREAGHGVLAERALAPIIPSEEEFPYSIRVESMITESNGSSSMASVCGGCLSMQDAGVPIKRQVAGVAMGLILNEDGSYRILTDILGSEDALGDMDFKVAGDADGITAFQMDIKVEGISLEIMREALHQAKLGRRTILEEMKKCSPPPRQSLGPYTPHIIRVQVDQSLVGMVIGSGGRTIRGLRESAGVENIQVLPEEEGVFEIEAVTKEAAERCKNEILALVEEPEVGKVYTNCKVAGAERFGLFVEFLPGKQGLLHSSELAEGEDLTDFDLDDRLDVTLLAVEGSKFRLSRKSSSQSSKRTIEAGTIFREVLGSKTAGPRSSGHLLSEDCCCRDVKVLEVKPYGVFIELPGGNSSLVHVSELYGDGETRRNFNQGDEMDVIALEPQQSGKQAGKQSFSRRRVLPKESRDKEARTAAPAA